MRRRRLVAEQREAPAAAPPSRAAREQPPPAFQSGASNAAVARMLQRDADAPGFTPVRPGSPLSMRDRPTSVLDYKITAPPEHAAAIAALTDWFDRSAAEITSGRSAGFFQSVAEIVQAARALPFTSEGKTGKVGDQMSAGEIEGYLRERAKVKGVRLLEHRSLTDKAGARSEAMAILENLGRIPTQVEFGGDGAKLVVSIAGKATGELAVGKGKLEAEVSPGGGEATYTLPGGKTKLEGRGGPEGGGGSVVFEGGKISIDVTKEQVKAEVKAGDLVTVRGSAGTDKTGAFAWKAEIQVGTLGKVATVEEIAKLMIGAQDTFGKAATDLSKGLSVDKAKEHGGAVKDAVKEVVEKAEKSAKQGKKGGWGVGLSASGDERGGWSAGITLTWVF
jgi:hypothetical protein